MPRPCKCCVGEIDEVLLASSPSLRLFSSPSLLFTTVNDGRERWPSWSEQLGRERREALPSLSLHSTPLRAELAATVLLRNLDRQHQASTGPPIKQHRRAVAAECASASLSHTTIHNAQKLAPPKQHLSAESSAVASAASTPLTMCGQIGRSIYDPV